MLNKKLIIMLGLTSITSALVGFISMYLYMNATVKAINLPSTLIKNPSQVTSVPPCNSCLYVTKTTKVNSQNNPILKIEVYSKGKYEREFEALSGRAYTQNLDRNVAGNKSPLPKGEYILGSVRSSELYETGGVFLPATSLFSTNRSALGIHVDPSWGLANGEDGTSGCIAVKSLNQFNILNNIIEQNDIVQLIVDY